MYKNKETYLFLLILYPHHQLTLNHCEPFSLSAPLSHKQVHEDKKLFTEDNTVYECTSMENSLKVEKIPFSSNC